MRLESKEHKKILPQGGPQVPRPISFFTKGVQIWPRSRDLGSRDGSKMDAKGKKTYWTMHSIESGLRFAILQDPLNLIRTIPAEGEEMNIKTPATFHLLFLALLVLSISFLAELSRAEDSASPTELLVQGSTFERRLHDLNGSASLLHTDLYSASAENNFDQVINYVPNLNWAGGTARPRFFQIRGIGELEQYNGAPNPSVGVIIDGIDFSGLGVFPSLFDTRQIEVFRGPQATKFGSSALGGVINLTSKAPTDFFDSSIELSAGSDDLRSAGVVIGGPLFGLSNNLKFRISTDGLSQNGFRENQFLNSNETNSRDEITSRLSLVATPSNDLEISLTGLLVDNDDGYDVFAIDNSFDTQSDKPGQDAIFVKAGSLKINYAASQDLEITSLTTRYTSNQDYSFDGDWGNNPFWGEFAPYDFFEDDDRSRSVYTEELKLSSSDENYAHGENYRWLFGAFGQSLFESSYIRQFSDDLPYNQLGSSYRAKIAAAFGEVEIPLSVGNSLTLSSRYEYRSARYRDDNLIELKPDDSEFGGSAAFAHDLSSDKRAYLSFAKGFKSGGVNPGIRVPAERKLYDPESLYSAEIGVKAAWLDSSLMTNLALFSMWRRDQQLKFAVQDDPSDPLAFTYITESSGRGQAYGADIEFEYTPIDWLYLTGSLSSLFSELTSVPSAVSDLDSRDFSHAPKWQAFVRSTEKLTSRFFLSQEIFGKDSFYFDDSHNQKSDAYFLLNLSAGLDFGNWQWKVWAQNVFDQRYATRGFFFGNEPPDFPNKLYTQLGDPLQVGTTISVKLN